MTMAGVPIYLYTVYRNSDDKLMVLDGDVNECVRVMKIKKNTFYAYITRQWKSPYTILRSTKEEIEKDMME